MTGAARCGEAGTVWAAQPGRRGEVYARQFWVAPDRAPEATGEIAIVSVSDAAERGLWVAADALDLGGAERVLVARSAAEALLALVGFGVPSQPVEPLYVEGPPIHKRGSDG